MSSSIKVNYTAGKTSKSCFFEKYIERSELSEKKEREIEKERRGDRLDSASILCFFTQYHPIESKKRK